MHLACSSGHVGIVKELIEHGAKISVHKVV